MTHASARDSGDCRLVYAADLMRLADDEPELDAAVRGACPGADDLASRVVRARVAAGLFERAERVRVGRYELQRRAGEGGGGVVYAAWDPELSRRVAIKLVDAEGRRDRVIAEAHALARLAHPNVVSIHDVGTYGEQIFIVMELVDGATLRAWVDAEPRSVREIVRVYREAGEGLAAAHRAGFVHRDFKPDNALIGSDGRVRVVDFGLAYVEGGAAAAGVGTPRYMAPEQLAGGEVTPAVDQYAFCASLREALTRRRDAHGTRVETVPGWLEAITTRGLARDPRDRFPSFAVLLRALANDPATRWKRRSAVAAVVIVGLGAFVVGRTQTEQGPTCPNAHAELEQTWSATQRSMLTAHVQSLATPYARQALPRIVEYLDAYSAQWIHAHEEACAARARGVRSDALFDRRMDCLDRARAGLASAVAVLRSAPADELADAVTSLRELPAVSRCSDPAALDDRIEPAPSTLSPSVAHLDRELATLEVQVRAGRGDLRPQAAQLVERARKLGYRPLLARALRLAGVAALALTARTDAIAPLQEATTLAFAAGADELGVELFARRAWSEGTLRDPERALAGLPIVEAVASRLPDAARPTRALLANNVGSVELAAGHRDRARARFEQAIDELAGSSATVELAQVPANLALVTDDPARRARLFADTIAQLTASVGPDHPLTLDARIKAASNTDDARAAEAELAAACTQYRELHPAHGHAIGDCAFELAGFALDRDDTRAARAWFTAAVSTESGGGAATYVALARAHLARLDGDLPAALAAFEQVRTTLRTDANAPWWERLSGAEVDLGIGLVARDAGDHARAKQALTRAAATLEQILAIKPNAARMRVLERAKRAR
jgi:predicted Ser/Thr protein kinase/tetratricopeptide (TPR) repeat protein